MSSVNIFAVLCGILVAFTKTATGTTACSPGNRTASLSGCLSQITSLAQDVNEFWFGTGYRIRCPNPWTSLSCFNDSPYTVDSLVSRMFGQGYTLNTTLFDRYIDVTFSSGTGEYQGCGNTWVINTERTFSLDPLSEDVQHPYDTKETPSMSWPSADDEYFTLIVFDAGSKISHGVFVNIPQNHLDQAEAITGYRGPLSTRPIENVYAFLLFRQPGNITVSPEWRTKLAETMTSGLYTISEVASALQLQGPIAMNWMKVMADAYSLQRFIDLGILYNCPYLITQALQTQNRTFIPKTAALTVGIDVQFNSTQLSFSSCCNSYSYSAKSLSLNPLGNPVIKVAEVRTGLDPQITLQKLGFIAPSRNFTDTLYSLITVDPDVPHATAGTQERPLLHYMVVNIPDGDVKNGSTVFSYMGPAPPDSRPHHYIFLLYEQTSMLNPDNMKNYTDPINSRYLFNISEFVHGNNLQLVGSTWMRATTDEYVRNYYVTARGRDESDFCAGVPGYSNPCAVGRASGQKRGWTLVFITMLILIII